METRRDLSMRIWHGIRQCLRSFWPGYVRLRVNEKELLKNLKYAYTESTTVLGELMQNARRAGATCIRFDLKEDGRLCISDDGCGIADLQVLFAKAESGWTQSIVDEEMPYGMGYLAAVFASETLLVESNGQRLQCRTEDLLRQSRIRVTAAETPAGTTMELQLGMDQSELYRALRWRASGFPIPVILNGDELPRPHAVDQGMPFRDTEFGQVYVVDLAAEESLDDTRVLGSRACRLYLQGLPVRRSPSERWAGNIVHLNSKQFAARMPDRDCLIDHDAQRAVVIGAIVKLWRAQLVAIRTRLDGETFANRYYATLSLWGALDLLDDVPVLPNSILFGVSGTPVQTKEWEDQPSFIAPYHGASITRDSLANGKAIAVLDARPDQETLPEWLYAHKMGVPCLTKWSLMKSHWVYEYVTALQDRVRATPEGVVVEDKFLGDWVKFKTTQCSHIELRGPLGLVSVDDTCLYCIHDDGRREMLIPASASEGGDIRQVTTFEDDCECWQETVEEREVQRFANYLLALHTDSGSQILERILRELELSDFRCVLGRTYAVTIDPNGNPGVAEHCQLSE